MANTVADLILNWNIKAGGYRDSLPNGDADKIILLNAAQHKLWQHLLAAGRGAGGSGNWFTTSAAVTFTTADKDKALAADCHDVSFVECTTSGWEEVNFEASNFYKDVFRQNRRSAVAAAPTDLTRYYVVSGDQPPVLHLDRKPNASISLTVHYTRILVDFTASTDSTVGIPTCYRDAIVNLAAFMNALSRHDVAIAQLYQALWNEDKALIAAVGTIRQTASAVSAKAYDNVG